jgi:hypothetical protein
VIQRPGRVKRPARLIRTAAPEDATFSKSQNLGDGVAILVAVIDDERVHRETKVLDAEPKCGQLFESGCPVLTKRCLPSHLTRRRAEAVRDVRRLKYNVVGVVSEKTLNIVRVPRLLPLLHESERFVTAAQSARTVILLRT